MIQNFLKCLNTFLFIVIFSSYTLLAVPGSQRQSIDSLEVKLVLAPDSLKIDLLNQIAEKYLSVDPINAIAKAKEVISIAETSNNFKAQSQALNTLAQAHRSLLSDFDKALAFSFQALKLEEKHKLHTRRAATLSLIAEIYKEVGNNYKALEFYMQSLVLYQELNETEGVINTFNGIGRVHLHENKAQKALEYHKKALALSRKFNLKKLEGDTYHFISESLRKEEKYQDAIDQQIAALNLRKEINDEFGMAQSLTALGEIYALKDNTEKGLQYHLQGIKVKQKIQDKEGLAKSYNSLGAIFIQTKEYERAIKNLEVALQYGVEENSKKQIRDSYELLYICHSALEDYALALQYKDLFIAISEFIYSEESERKIAEMQTKYEIDKKEDEIELLKRIQEVKELQIAKQNDLKNSLIIGLALCAIIAILSYYLYQTKRRSNKTLTATNLEINEKNKALEELNATKDKFFSIISHDLKGPLNSLTSFSGLLINHTAHLSKEEIQMLAKDLDKSVKGLFALLENLLEWSRSQSGNITLQPEVLDLHELITQNKHLLGKTAENKNISITIPELSNTSIMADRNSVSTVIRNLISNALKFTPEGGEVKIEARESSNMVLISIIDNGVGMSEEVLSKLFRIDKKHTTKGTANEKGTGLGLILCKEFVEKNGGTIAVESKEGEGSIFSFTLPKPHFSKYHTSMAS